MNTNTKTTQPADSRAVLEIDVNNHTGVMSHVAGLFSRRACNIEDVYEVRRHGADHEVFKDMEAYFR
jgi:glycine cleavage system regulatory protein